MSDAFEEIQAIKIKRNSLREKLQKRKRERHELFTLTSPTAVTNVAENTGTGRVPTTCSVCLQTCDTTLLQKIKIE